MPLSNCSYCQKKQNMGPVVCFGLCLLGCLIFNPTVEGEQWEGTQNISLPSPRSKCPPGVFYYNGFCYEFLMDPIFWWDAETECAYWRNDGHLASIESASEERVVSSYIQHFSSASRVWLGLKATPTPINNPTRLSWAWSDNTPYRSGSPLWDKRIPSTSFSSSQCVALTSIQDPGASARWDQYSCSSRFPYLCKFKASD